MEPRPYDSLWQMLWLGAVNPIVPDLVGEIPTEVAPYLFRTRVLAVEETSGGEVVDVRADLELLVGSKMLLWVVLYISKAFEDALGRRILLQPKVTSLSLFVLLTITGRLCAPGKKQV